MFTAALTLYVDFNAGFAEKLGQAGPLAVVKFCAEDCDHCTRFDNMFDAVVEHFDDADFVLGHFSCRTDPYVCKAHGVSEHPWIAIFRDGVAVQKYYGPRQENVIIDWIERWTRE